MSLEPGQKLAHYEIVELIGKGGMGEVYRAADTKLGRDVAIKVLPDELARDTERVRRFQREAKVLASLNHPNIASIHGLETSEGVHYLVLELVPGETLAERIAHGPIPVDEAIEIATKIADALEEAHEQGIVHRDLKPANIKLTADDKVKVLDFGLAKALVDELPEVDSSLSPTMTRDATRVGVILGTAAYMSPEQAKGRRVDKRTDIFAFGSVLYEMVTGRKAFPGEDVSEVLAAVINLEPDWSRIKEPSLEALLRRCLRKDPRERIRDIGDARMEMREPPRLEKGTRGEKRGLVWSMAAVTFVALVIAGAGLWESEPAQRRVIRSAIALDPGQEYLALLNSSASVAISPDGEYVAYLGGTEATRQLYLRAIDGWSARPIEGTEGAQTPFFSFDSEWLGFELGGALMKVSVGGGTPGSPVRLVDLLDFRGARGATGGPGGWFVFNRSFASGLSRVPENGGSAEILTEPDTKKERSHRFPHVLPGGEAILFTIGGDGDSETYDDAPVAVLDTKTGDIRVVLEGGTNPKYSPTGHLIYARAGALHAVPFSLDRLEVTGAPSLVVDGVAVSPNSGEAEYDIARDGTLIYAPGRSWGRDARVVSVDRTGQTRPLIETKNAYFGARLSPNGQLLALSLEGANPNIWLYDMSRETIGRVTHGFTNLYPEWTADSERLAFRSTRTGPLTLFWQSVTGIGAPELLLETGYGLNAGSFSPDGKHFVYVQTHPDTGLDLWLMDLDDSRTTSPLIVTPFSENQPAISPNGGWMAYHSDVTGRNEVYLTRFPETAERLQVSTAGGAEPRWRGDGRELYYRNGNAMMAADVSTEGDLALGRPRTLFERNADIKSRFDVTPDGQQFIIVELGESESQPTQLNLVQNWTEELKRLVPTEN